MRLAGTVRQYYLDNFSALPPDKQFHFATRLSAWSQDADCLQLLEQLKPNIMPPDTPVKDVLQGIITNLPETPINAHKARAPFFAKYPDLRGLMLALFRVRHMLYVYGFDARQVLADIKPYDELHALSQALIQDEEAMRTLSTYAINYIYLVEHILYDVHSGIINLDVLYKLGGAYDTEDKDQILLLIYLYTHCIIGETNYYQRAVARARKNGYMRMLLRLEDLLKQHFKDVNLDNKLEFLVCCRILGHDTPLSGTIHSECRSSVSPAGNFLIDTVNDAGQASKTSFASSEHRNVLFIMSATDYPHPG